jgi:hypothetical protein
MFGEAHWTLLQEAAERPHLQCRLYGNLYGRPGAIDWEGAERQRKCGELAAAGLLRPSGLVGSRDHPSGQWGRWTITEAGLKALRDARRANGELDRPPEPRSWR